MSSPLAVLNGSHSVALVGSGATAFRALHRLRSTGTTVRWYTDDLDVAEELLLTSVPPGAVEISGADPLSVDFSGFVAVVAASGTALDLHVASRAGAQTIPVERLDQIDLATFEVAALGGGGGRHHGRAAIEDMAA